MATGTPLFNPLNNLSLSLYHFLSEFSSLWSSVAVLAFHLVLFIPLLIVFLCYLLALENCADVHIINPHAENKQTSFHVI